MENLAIARIFSEIADLLEIKNDNPFKIRAYRNAADTIVHAAGQSNRKVGFEHFAVEGLAKRIVGSHWGLMPRMSAFLGQGLAEAVCLPQGQLSTLYRSIAAGRPGNLSRIGLGTFVDPRIEGGKVNQPARDHAPDYVAIERIENSDIDAETASTDLPDGLIAERFDRACDLALEWRKKFVFLL